MESGKFSFKTPILLLIFGFIIAAGINAQANSSLNGRWTAVEDGFEVIYDFRNGNYEILLSEESFGMIPLFRGTYTASRNEIVFNTNSIFGGFFNIIFEEIGISTSVVEEKWYSIDEFYKTISFIFEGMGFSESDIEELKSELIGAVSTTERYSLNGNILSMTSPFSTNENENIEIVFTRR